MAVLSTAARAALIGSFVCSLVLTPAIAELSQVLLRVEARNESGEAQFDVLTQDATQDPNTADVTWLWSGAPLELRDPDTNALVARVTGAFVEIRDNQELQVNVGVEAGTTTTEFEIRSAEVSFLLVPEEYAQCRAIATVSLTDTGGVGGNAIVYGLGPVGIGIFRAYYNGDSYDGDPFTDLVGFVFTSNGGSASVFQADPAVGTRPIGADVWSLSTKSAFVLTPNDRCSVTSLMGLSAPEWCPGDLDGDGVVNIADLTRLLESYGLDSADAQYFEDADFNRDDAIDLFDLSTLLTYFGTSCS